ncbi:hypothetical protein B0H19DRAFT_1148205, partial [Mycena capillaripes]
TLPPPGSLAHANPLGLYWPSSYSNSTLQTVSFNMHSRSILQAIFFSSRLQSFKTGAIKSSRHFSGLQAHRLMLISHQVAAKSSRASGVCNPWI